jgi:hypothetical protein
VGFAVAWAALESGHPFVAGLATGLIALKPQLGLVIAVVALIDTQWLLVAGAVSSIAAQNLVTIVAAGPDILREYAETTVAVARTAPTAEVKPYLQHSLRVIATLVPAPASTVLLLVGSIAVVWAVASIWRSSKNWRVRMGAVVIGSVLVDPHLYVYDATLLVLPGLWLGQAIGEEPWFWQRAYWIVVTLFVPTAAVIGIQLSVVLLLELLWQLWRRRFADRVGSSTFRREANCCVRCSTAR